MCLVLCEYVRGWHGWRRATVSVIDVVIDDDEEEEENKKNKVDVIPFHIKTEAIGILCSITTQLTPFPESSAWCCIKSR